MNTAIVDLIAISFLMSRDEELPRRFPKTQQVWRAQPRHDRGHGDSSASWFFAVKDMAGLADLYAVGVVGAIATNLGASSTDRKLGLVRWERVLMFCTFLIMLAIEISLFVDKPSALHFALPVLAVGLICAACGRECFAQEKEGRRAGPGVAAKPEVIVPVPSPASLAEVTGPPLLCAIRGIGRTLDFAIQEARETKRPLYLLFVRVLPVITEADARRKWQEDDDAGEIFSHAFKEGGRASGAALLRCERLAGGNHRGHHGHGGRVAFDPGRAEPLRAGRVVERRHRAPRLAKILPEDIQLLITPHGLPAAFTPR